MDSGNSGSLQSSSGAEEECDSRAAVDSISTAFATNHNRHPLPPFHHHAASSFVFDQNQINTTTFFATQQNPLLNLDNSIVWSKTLPSSSSGDTHNLPFFATSSQPNSQFHHNLNNPLSFPPATTTTTTAATAPATTTTTNPIPVRNPKKRSRASRRAPTTVLTTDTSNFRAMVQEFTGIPAPPFTSSSSSPFSRITRFDLFGSSSTIRSNSFLNNFDNPPQLPPYLLRPFPQKLQPPSSSSSSSSTSSISSLLNPSTNNNLSDNMQNTMPFPSNFLNQSLSLLNNFKTTQDVPASSDFGLIHGLQSSMPELISSDQTAPAPAPTPGSPTATTMAATTTDHRVSGMRNEGLMEPWICSSSD